jgi:MFS family permease
MQLAFMIFLSMLVFAAGVGSRVAVSLATLHLTDSNLVTSLVVGLYSVLPIFLGIAVGRMVDRFGAARPIIGAVIVSLLGMLLPFAWPSVWSLCIAAAAQGIAFMAAAMSLTNAGAQIGTIEHRTRNLSWIFLGNSAGMAVGPLIAGFGIDHIGHRGTFLLLTALPALSLVMLFAARRLIPGGRGSNKPPAGNLMACLAEPRLRSLIIPQVMIGACMEAFYFIVPLHGTAVGLSATTIGTIISCAFVANFAIRSFMPMLLRMYSEVNLVIAMFLIAAVSIAPVGFFSSAGPLMLLAAGVGMCHGITMPVLMSMAFTASPPGRQGEVAGARSMLNYMSIGGTQVAVGAFSSLLGVGPVMWTVAAITCGAAWLMKRSVRKA